jgi:hypothetical protein
MTGGSSMTGSMLGSEMLLACEHGRSGAGGMRDGNIGIQEINGPVREK